MIEQVQNAAHNTNTQATQNQYLAAFYDSGLKFAHTASTDFPSSVTILKAEMRTTLESVSQSLERNLIAASDRPIPQYSVQSRREHQIRQNGLNNTLTPRTYLDKAESDLETFYNSVALRMHHGGRDLAEFSFGSVLRQWILSDPQITGDKKPAYFDYPSMDGPAKLSLAVLKCLVQVTSRAKRPELFAEIAGNEKLPPALRQYATYRLKCLT